MGLVKALVTSDDKLTTTRGLGAAKRLTAADRRGTREVNWLSHKRAINKLGVSEPVLNALTRSGLLGYTLAGMVSDQAILSYKRFGTQWSIEGHRGPTIRIVGDNIYENLPAIESIGPQPPATQTHMEIAPADGPSASRFEDATKTDTGWIAHFYLVSNYFYFPNPTELSLIWPPPLKLSEPRPVPGADLPVTLYPHPLGYLGLVVVEGLGRPLKGAQKEAYDVAIPLLDELSVRYDVPLPVAHSMAVGVPSGIIRLYFAHRQGKGDRERGGDPAPVPVPRAEGCLRPLPRGSFLQQPLPRLPHLLEGLRRGHVRTEGMGSEA